MANTNNKDFNVCKNWGLRCFEMKESQKSVTLKCSMNRKDKETGEYTKPLYIDVICPFDSCDIPQDEYAKSFVNVDGQFAVDEYTNKNGEKVVTCKIFADKVRKSERG